MHTKKKDEFEESFQDERKEKKLEKEKCFKRKKVKMEDFFSVSPRKVLA